MAARAPSFPLLSPTAHSLPPPLKRRKCLTIAVDPPMAAAAPPSMDIISPASPMGLRLSSDVNKAATVFLSHVRRTFARFPVDYTGELVRLLDDIATFTCSAAASVSYDPQSEQDTPATIKQLYRMLAADGYCCIVLAKGMDQPLTFDDSVLHGNYVVCVSPLDMDTCGADERGIAGMAFSVFKRRSSTSLPGRGIDLQQKLGDQVAAGYASFSSATTLYYTMGHGVYSFVLHPVALQYFLQPAMRLALADNPTVVYSDRALLRSPEHIAASLAKLVDKLCCSMFTTGCLVGDVHQFLQTGGLLVAANVHLMCEAAPFAFLVEQCGGVATDEYGTSVLDMAITEDHNVTITLVLGTTDSHKNLALQPEDHANGIDIVPLNGKSH
ncbi:Fructose-1-6-bisphosphatase [Gracilaria domingensis]|nr:Fructose-1-6-bisphosphatase [Gracilaria domingensis]